MGDNLSSAGQKSQNINYIESLDQLRALAMLMVFFAHSIHNFTRGLDPSIGDWIYPRNPLFAILAEGHAGVALFMVLSGFLFSYGSYGKDVNFIGFMRNRVLRIYPMYIFILLLGAYAYKEQFSFAGFIASLMLFSNTQSALNGGMFTILLWTIAVEFTFYLVFPHLHKCYGFYGSSFFIRILFLFIILRLICVGLGASARDLSYFTIFGRMDQFLFGMLAAYQLRQGRLKWWSGLIPCCICFAAATVVLYIFNRYGGGWVSNGSWKVFWPTLEGFVFASMIVAVVLTRTSIWPNPVAKVLQFIGTISFSMYLLHQPVMSVAQAIGFKIGFGQSIYFDACLTGMALLIPVVALSWLSFTVIEQPFMALRKRYLTT